MRRMLLGLGALALTLTVASGAQAAERRHEVVRHEEHRGGYHEEHAVRFSGGYYYRGFDHHHWERQVWNARLNRWEYFDAGLNCYFYWCPQFNCYYPVTYVCP